MIVIGSSGFEFDSIVTYSDSIVTKTTSQITCNGKRVQISIDYSGNGLAANELHQLVIFNDKINLNDSVSVNIVNDIGKLLSSAVDIQEGQCKLCLFFYCFFDGFLNNLGAILDVFCDEKSSICFD